MIKSLLSAPAYTCSAIQLFPAINYRPLSPHEFKQAASSGSDLLSTGVCCDVLDVDAADWLPSDLHGCIQDHWCAKGAYRLADTRSSRDIR